MDALGGKTMDLNSYQTLASRTRKISDVEAINYAIGLVGECGEVANAIKKFEFHGHDFDETKKKVRDELGDVFWYVAGLASVFGLQLSEVAKANLEKLDKRYPDGFTSEASRNRIS